MGVLASIAFIGLVIYLYSNAAVKEVSIDPDNWKTIYWIFIVIVAVIIIVVVATCNGG